MYIALGLLVPIALLFAYTASRPGAFRISRHRVLDASPDAVFAVLNDFRRWGAWSPWEKLDPNMTRTFEGASEGVGARYRWLGNSKVGEGSMEITESVPNEKVVVDLRFLKPIAANNITTFTLSPVDGGTRVEWAMEGNNNFTSKLFDVVMNMDKLVGRDFENGLASMREAARNASAAS